MSQLLPPADCFGSCPSSEGGGGGVGPPGPQGPQGEAGANGMDGQNAASYLTSGFIMPAVDANVTIAVETSGWMGNEQIIWIQFGGFFSVQTVPTSTSAIVKNLGYERNVAPGASVPSGVRVAPGGEKGDDGALSGAAGGDLEEDYPDPRLAITTTKGDLIVNNGGGTAPRNTRLAAGSEGQVLVVRPSAGTGLEWGDVSLDGTVTNITGVLAVANGGTGADNAADARDNLALGSIATQDADNVAITGGSIEGTPIGTSVPEEGIFDDLSCTVECSVEGTLLTPPSTIQSLLAGTSISPDAAKIRVVGNGGAVTLTNVPTIPSPATDGQLLLIQGTDDTNTVTLQDETSLAGSKLKLGGSNKVLGNGDALLLTWDSTNAKWYMIAFSNN